MIAIDGIRYRNYNSYTSYRSCLPNYGIAIVRSLSFLFLDDFEGSANIFVAIKSGSTLSLPPAVLIVIPPRTPSFHTSQLV